jgi:hypothetical protein
MGNESPKKSDKVTTRKYVADQRGIQNSPPKASLSNTYSTAATKPGEQKQRPMAPAPSPANPAHKPGSQQPMAPLPKPASPPVQNPKKS